MNIVIPYTDDIKGHTLPFLTSAKGMRINTSRGHLPLLGSYSKFEVASFS